tara:strand:+ start:884 stop:2029 length:1146 start_codon:yes stop_codon:yes gene_type:complete
MGFLSTGMIIGLEEGFRTKQEEIADRQNQLTKDYRNEVKASIIKANDTIRTDRKKDEQLLTISQGIISSISEDLPGLAKKLKGLDQDTLIELGNTYLPLVKIEGANAATYKKYGHDLEKTIGTVLARDKQIREEKAKAAEDKTVEQQTEESFLDMLSPTRQGQIERDRINRGITEEQREVMGRKGAPKERRIIEGVAPQARERLSPSERSRFVKDSQSNITNIKREKLPSSDIENAQIVAATLIDLSGGDISRDDASLIDRYIEKLIDQNIKFTPDNTRKIREDIRDRGTNTVLSEIKEGKYKLPDTKPKPEQTDTLKKDDTDDTTVKESLKELLEKEGLTKVRTVEKGDEFIVTVTNKDKTKIFDVHVDKEFNVIKKVPK